MGFGLTTSLKAKGYYDARNGLCVTLRHNLRASKGNQNALEFTTLASDGASSSANSYFSDQLNDTTWTILHGSLPPQKTVNEIRIHFLDQYSPVSGYISKIHVSEGPCEIITSNDIPLTTLMTTSEPTPTKAPKEKGVSPLVIAFIVMTIVVLIAVAFWPARYFTQRTFLTRQFVNS